jgi:hypothetical protein
LPHLTKPVQPPNTPEKGPKKLDQRPKQSYLKKHIKKVPFGTFYFGARGARDFVGGACVAGAFGLGVALGLGTAFGLAAGAGFACATGDGTSTL